MDLDRTVILLKQLLTVRKVHAQHSFPAYSRDTKSDYNKYQTAVKLQFKTDRLPPHDTVSLDRAEPSESKDSKTHKGKSDKSSASADSMLGKWAKLALMPESILDMFQTNIEEHHK